MAFDEWKAANSDDYGLDVGALPADVAEQFARKVWGAAIAAERERCANICNQRSATMDESRRHEAQTIADLIRAAKA